MAKDVHQQRIDCPACPLQDVPGLCSHTAEQLAFLQHFKQGEMLLDRGGQAFTEGSASAHLATVLSGVVFRYKLLADGRRQVTNFCFPGDFLGLQGMMDEPLDHSVEALNATRLCLFPRSGLYDFMVSQPALGFNLVWLAAREEAELERHLMSVGRRVARERIAFLAYFLVKRARQTGLAKGAIFKIRITQTVIADATGMSDVHVNRTLQSLKRARILEWSSDAIRILDEDALIGAAKIEPPEDQPEIKRPFI